MNRRLALIVAFGTLVGARSAFAQDVVIGYQGLPYKMTGETQTGINVAEGTTLHVGAGAEAGYDSNVFYGNSSTGPIASSGILRFTGFGEITNAPRIGVAPSGLSYDLRAGLTYRRYTSNDLNVPKYANALMPSAGLTLSSSGGPFGFQVSDVFLRLEDPPYQGATVNQGPLTRDSNLASAQAQWSPGGGRITTILRYSNIIDIFEASSGYSYANNLTNQLLLDVSWKWLPKTAIYAQVAQGWVTYLNSNTNGKVDSYPLRTVLGLRGLITPRTTVVLGVGYENAFYASGATTGGLGSLYLDAQLIMTPTALSRVIVGYRQDYVNSVISQFYYNYSPYASYVQQIAGRLAFDLSARYSVRVYKGLLFTDPAMPETQSRTDHVVTVGASLDYFVRNWVYAGVGYALAANLSDYKLPGGAGVDYVKNQVFARLGLTY